MEGNIFYPNWYHYDILIILTELFYFAIIEKTCRLQEIQTLDYLFFQVTNLNCMFVKRVSLGGAQRNDTSNPWGRISGCIIYKVGRKTQESLV